MMKIKDPVLFKTMKEFLTHYLPEVRRKSPNTILSYKTAINLFLKFLSEEYNKKLKQYEIQMQEKLKNNMYLK